MVKKPHCRPASGGGASSMLYANGSYLTKAGRNLASVLAIVDKADPNRPFAWAVEEIQNAVSEGLVPQDIQENYQEKITRQDFCRQNFVAIS